MQNCSVITFLGPITWPDSAESRNSPGFLGGTRGLTLLFQGTSGAVSSLPPCLRTQAPSAANSQAPRHRMVQLPCSKASPSSGQFLWLIECRIPCNYHFQDTSSYFSTENNFRGPVSFSVLLTLGLCSDCFCLHGETGLDILLGVLEEAPYSYSGHFLRLP